MTGYTVHTGTSEKFSSGWDRIFEADKGKGKSRKKSPGSKKQKPAEATDEKKSKKKK
tara:strand:- start:630 stop:800 length:171 start_codon:yes stop_codon:yes gene_type:complete